MDNNITVVTQGMVFWFGENIKQEFGRSNIGAEYIIQGRRPHIVVSSENINNRGKICTIIPCTTNINIENPYHVKLQVFPDKTTVGLCEQMYSVNQSELLKNEFICYLDADSIEKIRRGCSNALGISANVFDSQEVEESLSELKLKIKNITDDIIRSTTGNFAKSFVSDLTRDITAQISSKFTTVKAAPNENADSTPVDTNESAVPTNTAELQIAEDGTYILPRYPKSGQICWSEELYHKFLEEYRRSTVEEMQLRWNLSSKAKVHQLKYQAIHRYDKYNKKGKKHTAKH